MTRPLCQDLEHFFVTLSPSHRVLMVTCQRLWEKSLLPLLGAEPGPQPRP